MAIKEDIAISGIIADFIQNERYTSEILRRSQECTLYLGIVHDQPINYWLDLQAHSKGGAVKTIVNEPATDLLPEDRTCSNCKEAYEPVLSSGSTTTHSTSQCKFGVTMATSLDIAV